MPGAPAARQVLTAAMTLGSLPPREFLSVATLLTLTESTVIFFGTISLGPSSWPALASRQRAAHRVGDLFGPRLHGRLIFALKHDAQQGLGPGVAHEHAPAAGQGRFDA